MMELDEVVQILLFHVYLETDKANSRPYHPMREHLHLLMKEYEIGPGIVDAAITELNGNMRLERWGRDESAYFKISAHGVREAQAALLSPTSLMRRALEKYSKKEHELLSSLKLIPAADRVVRRDDNSAVFDEAVNALRNVVNELAKSPNDLGYFTADDRVVVLSNLRHGLELLNAPTIRVGHYKAFIQSSLTFIAGAAANGVIGDLAAKALGLWERLMGLLT